MAKQFNGVFRAWMKVRQADPKAPPLIWGQCVVHLSNPEFSGNVLHTSGVLEIAEHKAIKIAETRNNFYALLGPELVMPADFGMDPGTYLEMHQYASLVPDMRASAAMTADQIGIAHVCTPGTNAHLVCSLMLEQKTIRSSTRRQQTSHDNH